MSYRITVQPSGHVFEAEAQENILQAGLRAGLNLNSRCGNGGCGGCRARLISGTLEATSHGDFVFSQAERLAGWFLPCRHRATSDLVIEAHETDSAAEIPEQHLVARVAKVERLQPEVILLQVRTPRSQGLQFLAGQGVNLSFPGMLPHFVPIASCPCDPRHLRFHLRYRAGDPFSEFVFGRLHKGREVVLQGPVGEFTLDEDSTRPLIFVAWESGFAPIESLIEHAIQRDAERPMHLYWLSGLPGGHYLSSCCRAWVDALDGFHYDAVDLAPAGHATLEGTLRAIVRDHVPLTDWDLYLSLPATAADSAARLLAAAGLPPGQRRLMSLQYP